MSDSAALSVGDVSKTFGSTRALDHVSLSFPRGAITALLGENGSGKSVLVKILAGVYEPDGGDGTVQVGLSDPSPKHTPDQARELGLRFLHQDLGLVLDATVLDNFAFSAKYLSGALNPIRLRAERRRAKKLLERFGVPVSPDDYVGDLSPSDRTMVAVARVFGDEDVGSEVVILDEPTAALPGNEVASVFSAMKQARDAGAAVILVSHRLEEVLEIADRVAVLRDGKVVTQRPISGLRVEDLVELMIGRKLEAHTSGSSGGRAHNDAMIAAKGLYGHRLQGVDLEVERGVIVGVAGLVGCGRSELIRMLAGVQAPLDGTLYVDGKQRRFTRPRDAIACGVVAVPQNRRREGVVLDFNVRENLTLGDLRPVRRGFSVSPPRERQAALDLIGRFDIRPPDPEKSLRTMSGGNQQKVAIARALRLQPKALLLDEPTQGIDIGARDEIGRVIRKLSEDGMSVILGSSDGDELLDLADRIVVLDRGTVLTVLERDEITRENLALAINMTIEGKVAA